MYIPAAFAVDDKTAAQLLAEIEAGDLVTASEAGLDATFLPLMFEPDGGPHGSLLGHLARGNAQWQRPLDGDAMVILRGPDAYISPSWYPSTAEHGRVVPTWNYVSTHVHGELRIHDDVAWVDSLVRRLTDRHEAGRDHPWSVDDAPAAYHASMLQGIVGIELVISRVEVKMKMSQNRPADIDGVIDGLAAEHRDDVADLVRRLRP